MLPRLSARRAAHAPPLQDVVRRAVPRTAMGGAPGSSCRGRACPARRPGRAGDGHPGTGGETVRWRTAAAGAVRAAPQGAGGRCGGLGLKPQTESSKPPLAAFDYVCASYREPMSPRRGLVRCSPALQGRVIPQRGPAAALPMLPSLQRSEARHASSLHGGAGRNGAYGSRSMRGERFVGAERARPTGPAGPASVARTTTAGPYGFRGSATVRFCPAPFGAAGDTRVVPTGRVRPFRGGRADVPASLAPLPVCRARRVRRASSQHNGAERGGEGRDGRDASASSRRGPGTPQPTGPAASGGNAGRLGGGPTVFGCAPPVI
jgi:hypothetical protein